MIGKIKLWTDDGVGLPYIVISDFLDPVLQLVPQKLVKFVTLRGSIDKDFVPDGTYRLQGAELIVETDRQYDENRSHFRQTVTAKGPTWRSVRELYSNVRSRTIQPEILWTDDH